MKEIEVDKKTFRDLWKSNKKEVNAEIGTNKLIKIKYNNQWLVCEPIKKKKKNSVGINIILAKYEPY